MKNKIFFNHIAEKWDQVAKHDTAILRQIIDAIELKPGNDVLDVGTGTGVIIPYVLEKIGPEGKILAVDIAENMLNKAKEKYGGRNIEYRCCDVEEDDIEGMFDYIICYSVFPHFQQKIKTIKKLCQNLKEDGKLMIAHSQGREAINCIHKQAGNAVEGDVLLPAVVYKEDFEKIGLSVDEIIDNEKMYLIIVRKGHIF